MYSFVVELLVRTVWSKASGRPPMVYSYSSSMPRTPSLSVMVVLETRLNPVSVDPLAVAACRAGPVTGKSRSRMKSKDSEARTGELRSCTLAYTTGVTEPVSRSFTGGFGVAAYARDQANAPPAAPAADLLSSAACTAETDVVFTCCQAAGTLKYALSVVSAA